MSSKGKGRIYDRFNVSVEYMKERKKLQRKKNYWNMRVK